MLEESPEDKAADTEDLVNLKSGAPGAASCPATIERPAMDSGFIVLLYRMESGIMRTLGLLILGVFSH